MQFCKNCENLYYIKISTDKDRLIHYCRKCETEEAMPDDSINSICVSKTHIKHNHSSFKHLINEYTKFDPTLPQINSIKCPNNECPSNIDIGVVESKDDLPPPKSADNKIIYIRYDNENMKYLYLCVNCDFVWETLKKDK